MTYPYIREKNLIWIQMIKNERIYCMNTKTYFSMHMPEFVEQWKHYKKGLTRIDLREWCIASDYLLSLSEPFPLD